MVQEFLNVGLLLLVVLIYNKNTFLNNTVSSTFGKMMWVVSIVFVNKYVNKTSGLILNCHFIDGFKSNQRIFF